MSTSFSLSSTVALAPQWTDTDAANYVQVTDVTSASFATALTNGTAAGQADAYWRDLVTIAAGGTYSADLKALPRQLMGGTATDDFAKVKVLCLKNRSTTATLTVGDTIADRWTALSGGGVNVGPEGVLYVSWPGTGYATSASDKALAITNGGAAAADIELYIVGVHA